MKSHSKSILIGIILSIVLLSGCKKDNKSKEGILTITGIEVYNITKSSASCIWNVNTTDYSPMIETGICYSTKGIPTIDDIKVASTHTGYGTISLPFNNLTLDTKYHLRAYVKTNSKLVYSDEVIFSTPTYFIGQNFGGGVIFYIDNTNKHGLISSKIDHDITSFVTPWSNEINIITGANSESDGLSNTQKIISIQGNSGTYAAKLCKDYRGGGFSDWFLPSKNELQLLYEGWINISQSGLNVEFFASFGGGPYWSSSEVSKDGATYIHFGNGGSPGVYNKTTKNTGNNPHVRSIRAF